MVSIWRFKHKPDNLLKSGLIRQALTLVTYIEVVLLKGGLISQVSLQWLYREVVILRGGLIRQVSL